MLHIFPFVLLGPTLSAQSTEPYVIFFDESVKARFHEMSIDANSGTVTFRYGELLELSNTTDPLPVLSIPYAKMLYQQRVNSWWNRTDEPDSLSSRTIEVFLVDESYAPVKSWELFESRLDSFSMDIFDGKIDNPAIESLRLRVKDVVVTL